MKKLLGFFLGLFLGLLLFVVSCSPQRKLDKLQNKHPDLFTQVMVKDTIVFTDTIHLEATENGDIFQWDKVEERTFELEDERGLTTVTIIPPTTKNKQRGQVFVNTIIKEVKVPVTRKVVVSKKIKVPVAKVIKPKWVNALVLFNVLGLVALILFILRKKGYFTNEVLKFGNHG